MQRLPEATAKEPRKSYSGFMSRLARDARGSTLAIVVAGLIPLIAMIGSGIEMSRIYMAKTRMQSACDAASLAARRVMTNDTLTTAVTDEAIRFFRFNFPQNIYDTATFTPTVTKPQSGTIRVQASTTIPSAIMYIFGHNNFELNVDCSASQNFVNTDVVLVLDVTGSMAAQIDGVTMISSLRGAVMALYNELRPIQTELEANGMRLRYGIVPYSSAVNVGKLIYAQNASYIADSWTYQSRRPVYTLTENSDSTQQTFDVATQADCNAYAQARTPSSGYPATAKTVNYRSKRDKCDVTTTTYTQVQTRTGWSYEPVEWDTAAFKTGASVALPSADSANSSWNGCIEERQTVSTITSTSGYAIPSGAYDLNIDLIPNSAATKWGPHWPNVVYRRNGNVMGPDGDPDTDQFDSSFAACPAEAVRLKAWTQSELQTYVNGLQPIGGTYHDIGMIWGARFISSAGIFGADNPDTYNNMPVAKHIIFMTDGQLAPNSNSYTSYGMEDYDQRVTGSSTASGQFSRHEQRFRMACNAAKGLNASIWVIGFGSDVANLSPALRECASNASQVSSSANQAQLIAKFTEIGKNIGALRLTQ